VKRLTSKKASNRGRPPKPDAERKDTLIRILVTADQKRAFTAAAERSGLDVSSWLRSLGVERARALGIDG
jgi:hypothetical protein